jgi:hypothetical protein
MAKRATREQQRQKKVNTRNAFADAVEYCERHGYSMPLEYFLAVGNGTDPRTGADVLVDLEDLEGMGSISVEASTKAMSEAAKYIYVPASKLEIEGHVDAKLAPVQIDEKVADSLAQKLQKLGIGAAPADK